MADRRAMIFVNGEQMDDAAVRAMLRPDDYRVAVDGGLRHLDRLGLLPHLLIGDLDSVSPEDIARLREQQVQIEQHPVHKDETDLELALAAVLRDGYLTVRILGGLGGRLDMTLANILLLGLPELSGVDARLEDGQEEVFLIRPGNDETGARLIEGQEGDRVSLIPLGGPARGVRTRGLYYPLRGETLYPERTRGISNKMVELQAYVTLESGCLVCIHTRMPGGQ